MYTWRPRETGSDGWDFPQPLSIASARQMTTVPELTSDLASDFASDFDRSCISSQKSDSGESPGQTRNESAISLFFSLLESAPLFLALSAYRSLFYRSSGSAIR
jgi:hypothetical protein